MSPPPEPPDFREPAEFPESRGAHEFSGAPDSIDPNATLSIFTEVPSARARRRQLFSELTLALVSFFWGATFALVKQGVEQVPVYWFLAMRFTIAAVPLWIVSGWEIRAMRREGRWPSLGPDLLAGAALGAILFLGYAAQTLGLQTTQATKSAFITGMVTLWTPLLVVVLWRRRPKPESLVALPVGVVGLFFLVFGAHAKGLSAFTTGDALTLVCSVLFAAHIVLVERLTKHHPTGRLAAAQITTVAALSLAASVIMGEPMTAPQTAEVWVALLVCALFATSFAFWAQARTQRFTTAERAAIIFLLEPVFGALTAYALLGEVMAGAQWAGAALILAAITAQEALGFFRKRREEPVSRA